MTACENDNIHDNDDIIILLINSGANIRRMNGDGNLTLKIYLERKSPDVEIINKLIDVSIYL